MSDQPLVPDSAHAPRTPKPALPPAEGERRAQRGYTRQYSEAAAAIYAELERGNLQWIGLAHRPAGILDDLVLGYENRIVGHQFKTSRYADRFTLTTFLMGADGLLKPSADSWRALRGLYPGLTIETKLVTNDFPSTNDCIGSGESAHSAAFLAELDQYPGRTLEEWHSTRWQTFISKVQRESGLCAEEFPEFWRSFKLLCGPAANFALLHKLSPEGARQAEQIADIIPRLVADPRDKDTWTRAELLKELGWRDPGTTLHSHVFPIGAYVQRNSATESALRTAILRVANGYVALVGPPGAGKSTLLQTALATESGVRVVRYLAYVPGSAQGVGRGEAEDFLADLCAQLRNSGLIGDRFRDESLTERRQQFGEMMRQAGLRYEREATRTLIVVDGLDHIPREEHPQHSLLSELPLPEAVPPGVIFVLGTQRLDVPNLKPAVRDQAGAIERLVTVAPLLREDVRRMADAFALDAEISRERLFELSHGHPLVTRYLIAALRDAGPEHRMELLQGSMPYEGDIETVYASAWRGIENDEDAREVLGYLARTEGPIHLDLLARAIPEAAIERALLATRHLLSESPKGWTVFHNSFRLFILAKPRIRLGRPDPEHSGRIYRELANLARTAIGETPQRWLELRYLARAQDHADVLALALPGRFREQLAEGRSVSELYADIRLAFFAARGTHDGTTVARLLLIHDEIGRRSQALEYATRLPEALLEIGDIEAAEAFVEEFPSEGYLVVDALLEAGQFDRAKGLFEKLEPLSQLLEGKFQNHGLHQNVAEFEKWADRVPHFRDVEQINEAIDHLSAAGLGYGTGAETDETPGRVANRLRFRVAQAVLDSQWTADPSEVHRQYRLDDTLLPILLVHAGLSSYDHADGAKAVGLFQKAIYTAHFTNVPNGMRRQMAFRALDLGEREMAITLFDGLQTPTFGSLSDRYDSDEPRNVTWAIVEHARLATRLGRPVNETPPIQHAVLRVLQTHAAAIGVLIGRTDDAGEMLAPGELTRTAKAALDFLGHARVQDPEQHNTMRQLVVAGPVIGRSLIEVAARVGKREFESVLTELDKAAGSATGSSGVRSNTLREVALAIYETTGDMDEASRRLEQLLPSLHETTPSEQIDGLAELSASFARIGNFNRARDLLNQVRTQTLGYALAPKKDPLYAIWLDLLVRANEADPIRRGERVSLLMRQVSGMEKTEGYAAAGRIAFELIIQATLHSSAMGLSAAKALSDLGLIGWPNLVDSLLQGLVRRKNELAVPVASVWCRLSLPYYLEPYYRYPHKVGDFIQAALSGVPQEEVQGLACLLRKAVEAEARAHERLYLLRRIDEATRARGLIDGDLAVAMQRWGSEAPEERHSYTPSKFDEVNNLADLKVAFEREHAIAELGYEAPRAFSRLSRDAGFEDARELFERWAPVREDARALFILFDLAVQAGQLEYARGLIQEYNVQSDARASWTAWLGGYSREYFRALTVLNGLGVHPSAYENFVDSVLAGRENSSILLAELDELMPVLTASPDWPAVWDLFAEQIVTTREYELGLPFHFTELPTDDSIVVGGLLRWAFQLPVPELRRQAQLAALELLEARGDLEAFESLVRELVAGQGDDPVYGMQLLLLDGAEVLRDRLGELVAAALNHPDYAVAEIATTVAERWQQPSAMTPAELPPFYQLELSETFKHVAKHSLRDRDSGAMRVESVRGWTEMFPTLIEMLECPEATDWQIQLRCRTLIAQWGGLDKFGTAGTKALQSELRRLDMAMGFERPHVAVAARALRFVAGELRRAGLISSEARPYLLHQMGYPAPALSPIRSTARPQYLTRPTLSEGSWRQEDLSRKWLQEAEAGAIPIDGGDEFVLAEVSRFEIRKFNRALYGMERLRVPRFDCTSDEGLDTWLEQLPGAYWIEGLRTQNGEPSPTIVRRLSVRYLQDIPAFQLVICPNWLRRLGWHNPDGNWLLYRDSAGVTTARIVWWRDGGPVDIHADAIWGEGILVILTQAGVTQLEAVVGPLDAGTHVRCVVTPAHRGDIGGSRTLHS